MRHGYTPSSRKERNGRKGKEENGREESVCGRRERERA
jgi:hypothetical protein